MNAGHQISLICTAILIACALAPSAAADDAGAIRVLRSWDESVEIEGRQVAGRMELVFDYDLGLAFHQIYDESGQLVERRPAQRVPTPSAEEIDAAVAIVLEDPALGRVIEDLKAYVSGGFILDEPAGKSCGPRTRCLQIFAFRLGSGGAPLFRAVVDLTTNKVVYRDSWNQGVPQ